MAFLSAFIRVPCFYAGERCGPAARQKICSFGERGHSARWAGSDTRPNALELTHGFREDPNSKIYKFLDKLWTRSYTSPEVRGTPPHPVKRKRSSVKRQLRLGLLTCSALFLAARAFAASLTVSCCGIPITANCVNCSVAIVSCTTHSCGFLWLSCCIDAVSTSCAGCS